MKKIVIITLSVICLTAIKRTTAQSKYSKQITEIKRLFDNTELGKNYHGAILIAEGDHILFQNAYGENLSQTPNTLDTHYDLASMGKLFAATALMQLIEQDKISLETTVGEILDDYPNEKAKAIQVKHLLSHTSGLGDYFGPAFFENQDNVKSLEDFLPFFVDDPLNFSPGETMRYSNAGYIVLGLIIQKVSGVPYPSYLEEHIFKPAKMNNTGPLIGSAGGGPSTVGDLHKFALALQQHKLVSEASLKTMTTDHYGHNYGFGMTLNQFNGYGIYGHNGGAPGIAGELEMVMNEPLIVVTMTNRHPLGGWVQMRSHLRREFFGMTPELEQFFNTEAVIKTYKSKGFESASAELTRLGNNIIDKNTFRYAEQFADQGNLDKAIEVMKLIVQAYADQPYPYAFLADFQLQAGQKEEAIKNFKKSLEINPHDPQVIERLKQLENNK